MSRHDGRIEVTGMVPDIRPYLHRAQIFVCPVRLGYGMRGKILEAMSARLAVVSTVLGVEGLPAQSGNNCLLADDPELMGHAINLLLEDPQLRRKIAENGQVMVRERFSWAQSLARMEDVLKSTLG